MVITAGIKMPIDPKLKRQMRRALFEANISQRELAERNVLRFLECRALVLGNKPCDVKLSTLESIARALDCELHIHFRELREEPRD